MNIRNMENPDEKGAEEFTSKAYDYIKVSDNVAKNIPIATLNAINSIISYIQMRGDNKRAFIFKGLAEEIITDKNITDSTKAQIIDVFQILANEIYSIQPSHRTHTIKKAVEELDILILPSTTARSLWDKVSYIFKTFTII